MERKKNGFTLVELLATIIILGIVVGLTVVGTNGAFRNAKARTEDVFVKTLEDALDIYVDSDAKRLKFPDENEEPICTINKTHKKGVKVYKAKDNVTFANVINSDYSPLVESEVVNPANEETKCSLGAAVSIYRDEDFVYYYKVAKSGFNCLLNTDGYISTLPSTCNG